MSSTTQLIDQDTLDGIQVINQNELYLRELVEFQDDVGNYPDDMQHQLLCIKDIVLLKMLVWFGHTYYMNFLDTMNVGSGPIDPLPIYRKAAIIAMSYMYASVVHNIEYENDRMFNYNGIHPRHNARLGLYRRCVELNTSGIVQFNSDNHVDRNSNLFTSIQDGLIDNAYRFKIAFSFDFQDAYDKINV
jgi:hypothetical protein